MMSTNWPFIVSVHHNRLIRLDSPNVNYLIISGAIIVYISDIAFVIPTLNPSVVSALCVVSWSHN